MTDVFMTTSEAESDHPLYLAQVELLMETVGVFYEKQYPSGTRGAVVAILGGGAMFQVSVGDDVVQVGPDQMIRPPP